MSLLYQNFHLNALSVGQSFCVGWARNTDAVEPFIHYSSYKFISNYYTSKEIEKRMEEMTVASTEMRKEINQRKLEVKTLKEDLDNYNRQIQIRSKDIEETTEQMQKLKVRNLKLANFVIDCNSKKYLLI